MIHNGDTDDRRIQILSPDSMLSCLGSPTETIGPCRPLLLGSRPASSWDGRPRARLRDVTLPLVSVCWVGRPPVLGLVARYCWVVGPPGWSPRGGGPTKQTCTAQPTCRAAITSRTSLMLVNHIFSLHLRKLINQLRSTHVFGKEEFLGLAMEFLSPLSVALEELISGRTPNIL